MYAVDFYSKTYKLGIIISRHLSMKLFPVTHEWKEDKGDLVGGRGIHVLEPVILFDSLRGTYDLVSVREEENSIFYSNYRDNRKLGGITSLNVTLLFKLDVFPSVHFVRLFSVYINRPIYSNP